MKRVLRPFAAVALALLACGAAAADSRADAIRAFEQRQDRAALAQFEALAKAAPDDAELQNYLGRARLRVGQVPAAVAALEWGACHFTHLYNAMTPLHHRDPGVVGAALTSVDATAELIADGIHVHPAALRIAVNAMPHRVALVTDAIRACGLTDGTYKLYDYEVTVADGAARLADGTLAGSVLTMSEAVKNMIELAGLPVETVIPMATEVPARIAAVSDRKGRIDRRYDADLVAMNDRFEVERVWARGQEVEG